MVRRLYWVGEVSMHYGEHCDIKQHSHNTEPYPNTTGFGPDLWEQWTKTFADEWWYNFRRFRTSPLDCTELLLLHVAGQEGVMRSPVSLIKNCTAYLQLCQAVFTSDGDWAKEGKSLFRTISVCVLGWEDQIWQKKNKSNKKMIWLKQEPYWDFLNENACTWLHV